MLSTWLRSSPFLQNLFMVDLFSKVSRATRVEQALVFLRLSMGLYFLYVGNHKLDTPDYPMVMQSQLQAWSAMNPLFWYRDFLDVIIIPNAAFFAFIVSWAEVIIGGSLILGFMVQLSLPVALFLNVNYLLASHHTNPAAMGINLAFIFIGMALYWSQAGHFFGLDKYLLSDTAGGKWTSKSSKSAKSGTKSFFKKPKAVLNKPKRKVAARPHRAKLSTLAVVPTRSRRDELDDDDDDD